MTTSETETAHTTKKSVQSTSKMLVCSLHTTARDTKSIRWFTLNHLLTNLIMAIARSQLKITLRKVLELTFQMINHCSLSITITTHVPSQPHCASLMESQRQWQETSMPWEPLERLNTQLQRRKCWAFNKELRQLKWAKTLLNSICQLMRQLRSCLTFFKLLKLLEDKGINRVHTTTIWGQESPCLSPLN